MSFPFEARRLRAFWRSKQAEKSSQCDNLKDAANKKRPLVLWPFPATGPTSLPESLREIFISAINNCFSPFFRSNKFVILMNQHRIPQQPRNFGVGRRSRSSFGGLETAFRFASCSLELIKYENGDFSVVLAIATATVRSFLLSALRPFLLLAL